MPSQHIALALDRDGVAAALIVAHQHGPGLEIARAGAMAPGEAVQQLERGAVERAESLFLHSGGDHPPEQLRCEVFRRRAPEHRLPAPPQRIAGQ